MTSPAAQTALHCLARHPDARRDPDRFGRRVHHVYLMSVPFACRPTGRILLREDQVTPGMIGVVCTKCGRVTEYEVVWPGAASEAA